MAGKKPRELLVNPAGLSIERAQAAMKDLIMAGEVVVCPCCKQHARLDEFELTELMGKALIVLYRHFRSHPEWLHVQPFLADANMLGAGIRGGGWAKLRFWGLLEEQPKTPGHYRLTKKGFQFAKDELKLPATIRMYNGKFAGYGAKQVGVRDVVGSSYDALMLGNYGDFLLT
jgi:hypothetical protein